MEGGCRRRQRHRRGGRAPIRERERGTGERNSGGVPSENGRCPGAGRRWRDHNRVYLRRAPIELEGIDVVAHRDRVELRERRRLENAGFRHRREYRIGQSITPEEIEEKNPFGLVDLFRGQMGVTVVDNMSGREIILRRGDIECPTAVYVDGIRVHELFTVQAVDVVAVEIYRGLRAPIEYSGLGAGCGGVVLFWTK